MGCIARLGCLGLLAVLAIAGWLTRDRWMPRRLQNTDHAAVAGRAPGWEPLSDVGAQRTREALSKLSRPQGPVFQTLGGGDVASYAFSALARQLPASTDSIQAMVSGDQVSLRANVRLADLGGSGALGPFASMLGDRERVQLTGTFHVVKPGLGEFEIQDVRVRGMSIPHGMIPRLMTQFARGRRPAGLAPDALPLPLPSYVGDIRVANGRITLYKNVE